MNGPSAYTPEEFAHSPFVVFCPATGWVCTPPAI
jgi:hypothetical protein